jgi:predicted metal-dependent phosphoesterase TrpH
MAMPTASAAPSTQSVADDVGIVGIVGTVGIVGDVGIVGGVGIVGTVGIVGDVGIVGAARIGYIAARRMAIKIDLHCHSFFSGDGVSSPEELIQEARKRGLNGFAMTDHNTCDAIKYMLDKGLMRDDGLPVDNFLVIPGVEVTTAEGHLLCLGVVLPNLKGRPAIEVCHLAHEAGGLAVPPHPYDLFRAGIRENTLNTLPIDAIEVFNAATTLKRYNRMAYEYAHRRGLPMTAASDAHHYAAIGTAYTIFDTEDLSVRGILNEIPKLNELNQSYMTIKDNIRKTWNNWMRLRKRKSVQDLLGK